MTAPTGSGGVVAVLDANAQWAQQVADRGGIPQRVREAASGVAYQQRLARATVEAMAEALYLALPYVTDAEGFPEHFKLGVVAKDVARVRAAIAAYERGA